MDPRARPEHGGRPALRPPRLSEGMLRARKRAFAFLLALALVALLAAVVYAQLHPSSTKAVPAVPLSAADRAAPVSLVEAAARVGFHPTSQPGIGEIESRAASAALPPGNHDLLPVGSQAPAFSLRTPTGQMVSLAGLRGKATLLEFFATWCSHCNAEVPHLKALYAALPHSKYAIVSVNGDGETGPSVFAFHAHYGLRYPALLDPSERPGNFDSPGAAGPVSASYHVLYFPTFYVLDPRGRIVWRSDGEQPDALLRQELLRAR